MSLVLNRNYYSPRRIVATFRQSPLPVSYTHLDVYKRQLSHIEFCLFLRRDSDYDPANSPFTFSGCSLLPILGWMVPLGTPRNQRTDDSKGLCRNVATILRGE